MPITITGNRQGGERIASLPLTKGGPFKLGVIYSEKLSNIKKGEKFLFHCEAQITSEHKYNVMIASKLALCTDTSANSMVIKISDNNGQNFNREEHHFNWTKVSSWVADKDYPLLYVSLIACVASDASKAGDKIAVDQDRGRLVVWRFTDEAPAPAPAAPIVPPPTGT